MRPALISMAITRMWSQEVQSGYARTVKDVAQQMCRMQVSMWDNFKDDCREGQCREDLLTDRDASGCAEFQSLSVGSIEKSVGGLSFDRRCDS